MDIVEQIISFEDGKMETEEEVVAFFQYLVSTGLAWQLQGSYGRQARAMIEAGLVTCGTPTVH